MKNSERSEPLASKAWEVLEEHAGWGMPGSNESRANFAMEVIRMHMGILEQEAYIAAQDAYKAHIGGPA